MRLRAVAPILLATPALGGCVGTVVDVVTLPVKAAGSAVDAVTTSQSEADENRGRELRKREERLGKLEREYADEMEDCNRGKEKACEEARRIYAEIQEILPTIPAEPPQG
jgi:DNA repair ATPase RecN